MSDDTPSVGIGRAWTMVALLSLLAIISFVDRFALGLLVEPLKKDLGVTDVQLGLLFGTAFAFFYGFITIPLARFADRGNRVKLILGAVTLWSACTIMSGFAGSFAMLLLLRIGLAVGEAALTPAAFSLIGDLLPRDRRTIGAAIFNSVGMVGASGAYFFSSLAMGAIASLQAQGMLADLQTWRAVLMMIGLPGLLVALLFLFAGREPKRLSDANAVEAASFADVLAFIRSKGILYPGLFIGAGAAQLAVNGSLAWTPTFLMREYAMPVAEAGRIYGYFNLVSFVSGSMILPLIVIWLGRRRRDAVIVVTAISALLSGLAFLAAWMQSTAYSYLFFVALGQFSAIGAASCLLTSLHLLTPPRLRATLTALLVICLTTLSLGIAPPLIATIADHFGDGLGGLSFGIVVVAVAGSVLASTLFFAARRQAVAYLEANEAMPRPEQVQ